MRGSQRCDHDGHCCDRSPDAGGARSGKNVGLAAALGFSLQQLFQCGLHLWNAQVFFRGFPQVAYIVGHNFRANRCCTWPRLCRSSRRHRASINQEDSRARSLLIVAKVACNSAADVRAFATAASARRAIASESWRFRMAAPHQALVREPATEGRKTQESRTRRVYASFGETAKQNREPGCRDLPL